MDPSAVVIFDGDGDGTGKPPFAPAAAVVLVTSPKPERYKEFRREGAPLLTFPVFSLAEMHLLRKTCFPAQHGIDAAAAMERRFNLWGGNPRAVLKLQDDDGPFTADMKFNVDEIMAVLEEDSMVNSRNLPHSVFHLVPRGLDEHGRMRNPRTLDAYKLDRIELGTEDSKKRVIDAVRRAFSSKINRLLCQPTKGASLAKFLCV